MTVTQSMPAAFQPAASTSTAALLGDVIALAGTLIARERSQVRPNRAFIDDLERTRRTAVNDCQSMGSADLAGLADLRSRFADTRVRMLAGAR
ncbi:MAG: hypothetical protein ACT4QG_01100 [Sporichthyaceae bacterium]